ncbi:phage holin family protein [Methylobacterium sp. A54F]
MPGLIAEGLRLLAGHLTKELTLASRELDGNLRAVLGLVAKFGGAAIVVICAGFTLLLALVKAVAALIGSEIAASLIVGTPFAAVAILLAVLGFRRATPERLRPRRTERQVARPAGVGPD